MARRKLAVGDTCIGKYGPHTIASEKDLERGLCKHCKRLGCQVFRTKELLKDPKYNTKMSSNYRSKMLEKNPQWSQERKLAEQARDPYMYLARCMLSSLIRADKLKGRITDKEVTASELSIKLRNSIGKSCIAAISCGGKILEFVSKRNPGSPSLDHINPVQKLTTLSNLRIICFDCNINKSDLTLSQAKALVSYIERVEHENAKCCTKQQGSPSSFGHAAT